MEELFRLLQFGVFALLVWAAYLSFVGRHRRVRERRRHSGVGHGGRRLADRADDPVPMPQPGHESSVRVEKSEPVPAGPNYALLQQ